MTRLREAFDTKALVAYLTFGDPDVPRSMILMGGPIDSVLRLAPTTAIESGKSTECMLTDSARCSRDSRTASERSVGWILKVSETTPSSNRRLTS